MAHDVKVKVDIVVGGEDSGCEFSSGEKMPKIGASIAPADAARALRVDRILILGVTRVLDEDAALRGVKARVTRRTRGENAIHHVDAERDVLGDLFGLAHAHQITRTIVREKRGDFGGHFAGEFVRFTDGEAADGVTGEINFE